MPIFEFHCSSCQQTFEKLLKTPLAEADCPLCGKPAPRKVSAPAAATDSGCVTPPGSGFR